MSADAAQGPTASAAWRHRLANRIRQGRRLIGAVEPDDTVGTYIVSGMADR
ncbi:hypothetical protein [Actinoallomurus liliacearum]|uniref:hypothetical protein n=1 Tax=Actinoallomurus liliacearum TaxID=1080073 RepID=UPI0031E90D65